MHNCWRCRHEIEISMTDVRPFVYHECSDGVLTANSNPNLVKKPRGQTGFYKSETVGKKRPIWQTFK